MISQNDFGITKDGRQVTAFLLSNKNGMCVRVLDYGCTIQSITAGDSVGATIVGWYCRLCSDPEMANRLSIEPPKGFLPRAVGLNCGLYRMERGVELLLDNFAAEYLSNGGTDEEYTEISVSELVTEAFPPCFVMTANGDFLRPQAEPLYEKLRALGVETVYRCYGDKPDFPTHVFHINIRLPEATACNNDECSFFLQHVK